jgi:hypothetical protein
MFPESYYFTCYLDKYIRYVRKNMFSFTFVLRIPSREGTQTDSTISNEFENKPLGWGGG